ncbi:hypothetical protein SVI_2147 [Shewanella violacea DSS12]|uniref:Uncharacterized protein n=1 Tax=Shewanella violacea (strain JCM 10179 / CIP 106290 / LMG 19151 / DSS12) TaxID=637905 RepID=D4ZKB9_SHEVD|nr:hypothetical protein SVI_2147 [Shewanella violacea DSS12]
MKLSFFLRACGNHSVRSGVSIFIMDSSFVDNDINS